MDMSGEDVGRVYCTSDGAHDLCESNARQGPGHHADREARCQDPAERSAGEADERDEDVQRTEYRKSFPPYRRVERGDRRVFPLPARAGRLIAATPTRANPMGMRYSTRESWVAQCWHHRARRRNALPKGPMITPTTMASSKVVHEEVTRGALYCSPVGSIRADMTVAITQVALTTMTL